MRRNRVLTILAVLLAAVAITFWLGSALAAATLTNEGLTVNEGSSGNVIDNTVLLVEDDTPGALITYTLVSLPAHGFLNLDGSTLSLPGEFTQTNIDASLLSYTHDGSENASDSFNFTVATSAGSTVPETTFAITVDPVFDQAPVLSDTSFNLAENSSVNTTVGTVTATDSDFGDTLTYTITNSLPDDAFTIVTSTGEIKVSDSGPLDFETNPTFTLTVEVEDSGNLTDQATITINLQNVNEPPTITPAGPFSLPEDAKTNDPVGTPITATDVDTGDSLTFSITNGNTGGVFALSAVNATSSQIIVANENLLDYDTPPTSYTLTIRAQDIAEASDGEAVVINLTPVNEPPAVSDQTLTVDENSPNGTEVGTPDATDPEMDILTYSIIDGDVNVFDINGTSGQITVEDGSALDFEALGDTPHFTLTVEVSDGVLTDTAEISINVNDINEIPTVNEATFSLMENSSVGTAVGTVIASDPEGPVTFAIVGGNTSSAFAINVNTGQITVANSTPLNYEVTPTFNLTIQVTDNGLPEPIDHKTNTASITINLTDKNEAPTVNNATFIIQEDSPNGAAVGTVTATDPDTVDTLTFSIIGGNAGTAFAINPTTGQITVNDSTKLDADTMPTYNLTVQVLDKGNLPDTATVTINVDPLPITHIYLPIMLNNYPPIEPNNHCGQAYAIGSGITYEFTSDDVEDWYAFTLTSPGNLTITLSNFEPAQGQLVVYGGVCGSGLVALQNNGNSQSTKIINLGVRPAGTYYIRVYSVPVTNTTYNLRVN
ncbi:MAG: cadherin domain-containing protein [Anaerolineaceae bacterium]|nr:cadherin domain-containing protein [Anaerolineaceae bacterium]